DGTGSLGAVQRGVDVVNDEIEVNRRPVARIVAPRTGRCGGGRAFGSGQEIDRGRGAEEFEDALAETPADMKAEPLDIKGGRLVEIGDIDIDEKVHDRSIPASDTCSDRLPPVASGEGFDQMNAFDRLAGIRSRIAAAERAA